MTTTAAQINDTKNASTNGATGVPESGKRSKRENWFRPGRFFDLDYTDPSLKAKWNQMINGGIKLFFRLLIHLRLADALLQPAYNCHEVAIFAYGETKRKNSRHDAWRWKLIYRISVLQAYCFVRAALLLGIPLTEDGWYTFAGCTRFLFGRVRGLEAAYRGLEIFPEDVFNSASLLLQSQVVQAWLDFKYSAPLHQPLALLAARVERMKDINPYLYVRILIIIVRGYRRMEMDKQMMEAYENGMALAIENKWGDLHEDLQIALNG